MAKIAATLDNWTGYSGYALPSGTYDSAKIGLGPLMYRYNDGGNLGDFIGPMKVGIARPFESASAQSPLMVHALDYSSDMHWVFIGDSSTATTNRRIMMYEYVPSTSTFTVKGHILVTPPSATNHTLRGFRMTITNHTTGTVAVSGTAVTGTSTTWQTDGACVGNRIGFGSTDPTQITAWYTISAIGSNTGITLSGSAGTISAGTAYVIEDLRCIMVTTASVTTNGGLFVAKGLQPSDFVPAGTTIAAAVSTDNLKATYWLKDAATVNTTVSGGLILEPETSKTSQFAWVTNGTTTVTLYKFNIRAALTVATGGSTSAYLLTSAAQAVTGTNSQINNGRYAVTNHGPGSGLGCGYLCTTTRMYRTVELSTITAAANWQGDAMTEVPPGGTNTYALTNAFSSAEYVGSIDRFVLKTTNATSFKDYVTKYNSVGNPLDRIFMSNDLELHSSLADSDTYPHLNNQTTTQTWVERGIAYSQKTGTSNVAVMYAWPLGADWEYTNTSHNKIILPAMNTPNADSLHAVYFNSVDAFGSTSNYNLAKSAEPFRFYYRTAGISDNSGTWYLLDRSGDLTGIAPSTQIQFMLEFRTIGDWCIPARILSCSVVYNDLSTDSHYQPSVGKSSVTSKVFAWRFATAFGSTVPTLRIRLYNAISGLLLLDDTTVAPGYGTWAKTTDGTTWSSYNDTDKANETTYIRYTPSSLADDITVRALLTLD